MALGVLVVASLFDAGGRFGFLPLVLSTLLTLGTAATIGYPDVATLAPVAQATATEAPAVPATTQLPATTETPADPAAQPATAILAPLDLAATYGAITLSACAGLVLLLLLARPDRPHSIWSWTLSVVATLSALVALTRTAWEPLSQTLGTQPALAWLGPPLESLAALPALSPANAVMVLGGALAVAVLGYIAAQIA